MEYAFINSKGEISPKYNHTIGTRDNAHLSTGRFGNFFQVTEKGGTAIWLDQNLKELGRAKTGEQLIYTCYPHNLLLDAKGNVIRAIDDNFKTVNEDTFIQQNVDGGQILHRLKNGKWTKLDLRQYLSHDGWNATPRVICDDYIIICLEKPYYWSQNTNTTAKPTVSNMSLTTNTKPRVAPMLSIVPPPEAVEVFAVDWNGKRIKSPLAPYFEGIDFETPNEVFPAAGPQGPNYYWVETKGKRGYVNTKGEWLFVDNIK